MKKTLKNNMEILTGIYKASWRISLIVLWVVVILEIFMLIYSVVNSEMYGEFLWKYRIFYIALLLLAVFYIILSRFIKKDVGSRYKVLRIVNPIYAVLFFAWSLGITWSDVMITNAVDPAVFMTLSMVIPLSFYLTPVVFTIISATADIIMIIITASVQPYIGILINLCIFFIFQFLLGISFLKLKARFTERIIVEQKNAKLDVLTGFSNRRAYMEDLAEQPMQENLVYIAIDINGLKDVNDAQGHEAGDKLIMGAAQCIEQCFGDGKMYRIGGDEFVVLICTEDLQKHLNDYVESMRVWSQANGMELSTSYGCACINDVSGGLADLSRTADERMYSAKAEYYRNIGKDRRRRAPLPAGIN